MKLIYYYTLGCKVNQCETENIKQRLCSEGFDVAQRMEEADMCIINSCTVTSHADKKLRQFIHKVKRINQGCAVLLTGCFPQASECEAKKLCVDGLCDIVTGNGNTARTAEAAKLYFTTGERVFEVVPHSRGEKFEAMSNTEFKQKTRGYIKIQDGCDRYCSYCIIPYSRGHARSKPLPDIISEAQALAKAGHLEIVLTGINLCCYGSDLDGEVRLVDAVEAVCGIDGVERVRLGSIEPEMISDEDIARLSRLEKLCPQFHLSLQSGCDKTLKAMNRHYTAAQYLELTQKLRAAFPDCALTTDVMVGFAGETDEDFRQSMEFVRSVGFAKVHIFPYSVRNGTAAQRMEGHVSEGVKQKRAELMSEVCKKSERDFLEGMVGKRVKVLFEKENCTSFHGGYSENYTHIKIVRKNPQKSLRKCIFYVIIKSVGEGFCLGELSN